MIANYDRESFHYCAVRALNDTALILIQEGNALIQRIIKDELILKPIDCILFQQQFLIVTDPVQENPKVVCISYETEDLTFVLEDLACPFGLCQFGNHILLSDQGKHTVYKLNFDEHNKELFIG